jgi:hypothetical protein
MTPDNPLRVVLQVSSFGTCSMRTGNENDMRTSTRGRLAATGPTRRMRQAAAAVADLGMALGYGAQSMPSPADAAAGRAVAPSDVNGDGFGDGFGDVVVPDAFATVSGMDLAGVLPVALGSSVGLTGKVQVGSIAAGDLDGDSHVGLAVAVLDGPPSVRTEPSRLGPGESSGRPPVCAVRKVARRPTSSRRGEL